jgi:hypothetical protein
MLRNKLYRLLEWYRANVRLIYFLVIFLALSRFFYLNYINWTSGELCTGQGGIQYGYDSFRYLDGADKLINHQDFILGEDKYTGYIFLIAFVKSVGLDLSFVLIIQLMFALLAALALYDIAKSVTQRKIMGLIAAGFYLINPFIAQWHLFIHTESFYSSMLTISAWSIYKAIQKNNLKFYIISLIIVFYTALIRPNGWILVPVFFVFAILIQKINFKIKVIAVISVITIFLLMVVYMPIFKNDINGVKTGDLFLKGEIIWGFTDLRLKMPSDNNSETSYQKFGAGYVLKHPLAVTKLMMMRVTAELLPVFRPKNSTKFIIRFLLWMLPAYILSILGAIFLRKNINILLILSIIISHLLIIAVTYSEQEFRFLIYILPLIYLMATFGIFALWKYFSKFYLNPTNNN